MWLDLPYAEMNKQNSCLIKAEFLPYKIELYDGFGDGIRVLKVIAEEVQDIIRRYALIYPCAAETFETEDYTGYRCLVNDEATGITRAILEKLGYTLEESEFTPYGIYWITLKTRVEKRKKK